MKIPYQHKHLSAAKRDETMKRIEHRVAIEIVRVNKKKEKRKKINSSLTNPTMTNTNETMTMATRATWPESFSTTPGWMIVPSVPFRIVAIINIHLLNGRAHSAKLSGAKRGNRQRERERQRKRKKTRKMLEMS